MADHQPERTCVACRTRRPRAELVRIVRRPDGEVVLDETGTSPGRGAYLCPDPACWALALRRTALQRGLRTALPTTLTQRLEQGALAATPVTTGRGASALLPGGSHGT